MKIVPVHEIPRATSDVPDDPMAVYKVCLQMEEVCRAANGLGLSAVQVGLPWRLFVTSPGSVAGWGDRFNYWANCDYEGRGERLWSVEGCLSLPGRFFRVGRFPTIHVGGLRLDVDGDRPKFVNYEDELSDTEAVLFQHEIEHQNGVLISEAGTELFIRRA